MKRIMAMTVLLLLLAFIKYALVNEPPSSASTAMTVQGTPFFSINNIEVTEGTNPQAIFTVSLTYQGGSREFSASVNYSTSNGTAIAAGGGGDYEPRSGTVNFPPGPTPGGTVSKTVSVPIIDDNVVEGDETFTVALSNPNPAFVIQGPGACIIHDNDSRPAGISVLDTFEFEGDSAARAVAITVENTSGSNATVDFATENLSAVAGRDYNGLPGTLSIQSGSQATVALSIIGDTVPEWPERFFVRLSNARGAPILDGEGICEIRDNDDPGKITVCSNDPVDGSTDDRIESTITVDSDIIADHLEVSLFVRNRANASNLASFQLERVSRAGELIGGVRRHVLFEGLRIPFLSSVGTTCTPLPDFVITDDAARLLEDNNDQAPYVGRWRGSEYFTDFEGLNARTTWQLRSTGVDAAKTLECWCLSITGLRDGLRLEPSIAMVPIFEGVGDGDGDADLGIYSIKARLNDGGSPVSGVPVTFTVRDKGGLGNVILREEGLFDFQGDARFRYANWVPGEHTIEARAEVNGAIYTDIARVTWINPCAATQTLQGTANAETTLSAMRQFRDSKLASSKRGQQYTSLYYRFTGEAVRTMMFNPMMLLRSQEMIERYMPVLRDMTAGKEAVLTDGDLKEMEDFMNYFAAKGSVELKQAAKGLSEDLRNPEMHKDLGFTVRPGPRRELSGRGLLQSLKQAGIITSFFGLFLALGCFVARGRKPKAGSRTRGLFCLTLALVLGGQWLAIGAHHGRALSRERTDSQDSKQASNSRPALDRAFNNKPIGFEANRGQADPSARFISRGGKDSNLFLTNEGGLTLVPRGRGDDTGSPLSNLREPLRLDPSRIPEAAGFRRASVLKMTPIGANLDARITGVDELPTVTNYFVGTDRSKWRAGVPSFAKVKYESLYEGVDLLYYGKQGQLEYDFIVAPQADPNSIKLAFDGADRIEIDSGGDLVLHTPTGEVRHRKPLVYQEVNGIRLEVPCHFKIRSPQSAIRNREVGFEVESYDRSLPLVIDPVLEYSTYLGGSGDDQGTAISVDSAGNAYLVGITDSIDLPVTNASQPNFGGGAQDAFVAKLDPSGTQLLYLTYLGGAGNETATGMAVDSSGNAYVTGFTDSNNFPSLNALQPNNRGRFNGFVSKLGPTGNLIYSTYLGGTASDSGSGVAVDSAGNVYVAGIATSPNLPTVNALQPNLSGASDLYVAKLNTAGNQILYSTYLGGSQEDAATSIAADSSGNVYVTGATLSTDFRTANATQANHGGGIFDAFVVKLNPSGDQLLYSTYLGGAGGDRGMRITADSTGSAFVTGDTFSTNFPVVGAFQQSPGGSSDAFVAKLSPNGSLAYSTYLGGSGIDGGTAISVDASGAAYVTGFTSENFPTHAALQPAFGGGSFDAFIAKLNKAGSALDYSTYLGGSDTDSGFAIAIGPSNSAYVMGLTGSVNFRTVTPFQPAHRGGVSDVFVAKIRPGPIITSVSVEVKHLIVMGGGFELGAVILLNGEDRTTKYQSVTSLKGKKVAKTIASGQTVRLQVRNPDGLTSNELNFTRP